MSLNPSTFVVGAAVPDGIYRMKNFRWEEFDYGGRVQLAVKAFALTVDLFAPNGQQYTQSWTCGDVSKYRPSADGKAIDFVGSSSELPANSNAYELLVSLVNAGYPTPKLDAAGPECSLSKAELEDIEVELTAKTIERAGLDRAPAAGATTRKPTTLVVKQIIHLPWDTTTQSVVSAAVVQQAAAAVAPAVSATTATPPPPPASAPQIAPPAAANGTTPVGEVVDDAQVQLWASEIVAEVMGESGGRVKRLAFTQALFKRGDIPQTLKARVSQLLGGNWPAEMGLVKFEGAEAVAA